MLVPFSISGSFTDGAEFQLRLPVSGWIPARFMLRLGIAPVATSAVVRLQQAAGASPPTPPGTHSLTFQAGTFVVDLAEAVTSMAALAADTVWVRVVTASGAGFLDGWIDLQPPVASAAVAPAGPFVEPLHLEAAKAHLRVTHNRDDALIAQLIAAVRTWAQDRTARVFVVREVLETLEAFPSALEIELLEGLPAAQIVSVKYTDEALAEQTMPAADYVLRSKDYSAQIVLAPDAEWPIAHTLQPEAVRLRYVAGYLSKLDFDESTDQVTITGRTVSDDDLVRLSGSGGVLPTGLQPLRDYHVVNESAGVFQLSLTQGGGAVNFTDRGSGHHYAGELPVSFLQAMLLRLGALYALREDVLTTGAVPQLNPAAEALLSSRRIIRFH